MHLPEKWFGCQLLESVFLTRAACGCVRRDVVLSTGGCWHLMDVWFFPLPFARGPFPLTPSFVLGHDHLRKLCVTLQEK